MFLRKKRLGLALGGGAARGFAHIGVLKALSEGGVAPSCVAGTSVGSLIGALYCAGHTWEDIWQQSQDLDWGDLVKITMPTMGLVKPQKLESLVDKLVNGAKIEDLPIPFQAVAVDLVQGQQVILDRGPVGRAVRASCSIPGIFTPLEDGERLLADGGVLNNLPADVLDDRSCDYILAVDLTDGGLDQHDKPENLAQVMLRSTVIFMSNTGLRGRAVSDMIVVPKLAEYGYHDMSKKQAMMDAGYEAMMEKMKKLKKRL